MDKVTHLTILYDYYGGLFNEKQKAYFEDYYFNNLSLAEISENVKVSRNAIHKQIKNIEAKLFEYEKILELYNKNCQLTKILNNIKDEKLKEQLSKLI